jgi:hypothetical protein
MGGAIPQLPLYGFMVWTGVAVLFKLKLVNSVIEIQEVCHVLTLFCVVPASVCIFYL